MILLSIGRLGEQPKVALDDRYMHKAKIIERQFFKAGCYRAAFLEPAKGELGAWLAGITRHTVLDFLRRI